LLPLFDPRPLVSVFHRIRKRLVRIKGLEQFFGEKGLISSMAGKRVILGLIFGVASICSSWFPGQVAHAACGFVTCFVVVGSQQQIPQAGLLTFNTLYNYTPMRLLKVANQFSVFGLPVSVFIDEKASSRNTSRAAS